jgi:hypothetical protein
MDIYRQGSQKFRQGLKELAKSETPRREVFGE